MVSETQVFCLTGVEYLCFSVIGYQSELDRREGLLKCAAWESDILYLCGVSRADTRTSFCCSSSPDVTIFWIAQLALTGWWGAQEETRSVIMILVSEDTR